jgi:hypothetical protein
MVLSLERQAGLFGALRLFTISPGGVDCHLWLCGRIHPGGLEPVSIPLADVECDEKTS